jgi:hypothetical protein
MLLRHHHVTSLLQSYKIFDQKLHQMVADYDPALSIMICPNGFGEIEWAHRLLHTCTTILGWHCTLQFPNSTAADTLAKKLDLVIYMRDPIKRPELVGVPSYLAVSDCSREWFSINVEALRGFDGLLSAAAVNLNIMQDILRFQLPVLRWFPSCHVSSSTTTSNRIERTSRNHVFYCGTQWDARRTSDEFERLYAWLHQKQVFRVYGLKQVWGHMRQSWCGQLPPNKMVDAIAQCGISLVLHSAGHMNSGAPTSRIFEAAAALTVIISDRHPFVLKYFSDCALFLFDEQPLEQQMDNYLEWIKMHPMEASTMAQRAHQVAQQWDLLSQLDALADFHCRIMKRG